MIQEFARLVGTTEGQAAHAIQDEASARRTLSRRGFLSGALAIATQPLLPELPTGRVYSFLWQNPIGLSVSELASIGMLYGFARSLTMQLNWYLLHKPAELAWASTPAFAPSSEQR